MVRIRLRRVGARNQASFRIVAADRRSPRDGRFLAILGHYNPRTEPATISVNEAELFDWLSNGAMPSESVMQILKLHGTWDRWKRYKSGEELGSLLAEAAETAVEVDPRTRRDDREHRKPSKKARARAEAEAQAEAHGAPEPVTEADDEPELEAQAEGEAVAEVEAEAEGEAEVEPQADDQEEPAAEVDEDDEPTGDEEPEAEGEQEPGGEPEAEASVAQAGDEGEPEEAAGSEPDEEEEQ